MSPNPLPSFVVGFPAGEVWLSEPGYGNAGQFLRGEGVAPPTKLNPSFSPK
jgi:hypothetical protein